MGWLLLASFIIMVPSGLISVFAIFCLSHLATRNPSLNNLVIKPLQKSPLEIQNTRFTLFAFFIGFLLMSIFPISILNMYFDDKLTTDAAIFYGSISAVCGLIALLFLLFLTITTYQFFIAKNPLDQSVSKGSNVLAKITRPIFSIYLGIVEVVGGLLGALLSLAVIITIFIGLIWVVKFLWYSLPV